MKVLTQAQLAADIYARLVATEVTQRKMLKQQGHVAVDVTPGVEVLQFFKSISHEAATEFFVEELP